MGGEEVKDSDRVMDLYLRTARNSSESAYSCEYWEEGEIRQ